MIIFTSEFSITTLTFTFPHWKFVFLFHLREILPNQSDSQNNDEQTKHGINSVTEHIPLKILNTKTWIATVVLKQYKGKLNSPGVITVIALMVSIQ